MLFENLSLTVDGPAVLWAPSGWGKTTLLRILMGLETPDAGRITSVGRVSAVFRKTGSVRSSPQKRTWRWCLRRKSTGQNRNTVRR